MTAAVVSLVKAEGDVPVIGELRLDRFPVAESGKPQFADRFGTGEKEHHGTDIFAPRNTPVLAVRDGRAHNSIETKGGNVVYLVAADGSRYFYAHLDRWEHNDGQWLGSNGPPYEVKAGDVIGYVGNTGNALGKAPHLHFQMAPAGKGPVDPFEYLKDAAPDGALVSPRAPGAQEHDDNTLLAAAPLLLLWWASSQKGSAGKLAGLLSFFL